MLLWLAALQFAVAYWWWKGPHLGGTRGWVAALFLLNGAATVLNLGGRIVEGPLLDPAGSLADQGTNLALFAFGLVALDVHDRWPRLRRWVLGAVGTYTVIALAGWFPTKVAGTPQPPWTRPATAHLILLAFVVGGLALVRHARRWGEGHHALWTLALAGVGLRYAEVATWLFLPHFPMPESGPVVAVSYQVLKPLAFFTMLGAFAILVWWYRSVGLRDSRRLYEISVLLILFGFLFGAARALHDTTFLGLVFTVAFVRPMVFLEVRTRLGGGRLWSLVRRPLVLGAGGMVGALVGTGFGAGIGMGGLGSFFTGAAVAPVGSWMALRLWFPRVEPGGRARVRPEPGPEVDWPVDEEVTLPEDWRDRTRTAYEAYLSLPQDAQDALADLSHWQRILLALDGASEAGGAPPYERTTPGLHFLTHCPYSSVGSEITRMNDRWEAILDEYGIEPPNARPTEGPLVEDDWGRAQGLDSPRVKHYDLTPLGRRVAQAIREEVGLGDADPEQVARVVADGFEAPD